MELRRDFDRRRREVIDSSENGNHGQAIAGANSTDVNPALVGDPGSCNYIDFNGAGQRVSVPYNTELNPAGDFTISAWVRADGGQGQFRSPLTSRSEAGGSLRGYMFYASFLNTWAVQIGANSSWSYIDGGAVNIGQWTHIAATYDATSVTNGIYNGTLTLYIDGIQVAQTNSQYLPNNGNNLTIGGGGDFGNQFLFNGGVDSVNIFNAALTDNEISALASYTQNCGTDIPQVSPPADVVTEATALLTPVDIGNATALDPTDGNLPTSPSELGPFPLGETQVVWTATDIDNNSNSAIQRVTIVDTTAPIISVPADVAILAAGATAVPIGSATASDIFNVTLSNDAPRFFQLEQQLSPGLPLTVAEIALQPAS